MKVCKACGKTKPPSEFHIHRGYEDNRNPMCKDCRNKKSRDNYIPRRNKWIEKMANFHISKEDSIWLAGCIDCDGSIGFNKIKHSSPYRFQIDFGNTNKAIVEKIRNLFQVNSITERHRENTKIFYRVTLSSRFKVYKVLKSILPYLIVKKDRAKFIIDVIENLPKDWHPPLEHLEKCHNEWKMKFRIKQNKKRGYPPRLP